tara:strand:- start:356 stop:565 length:210 start_codon:yes stop_codon:yes gene_type:complete
MGTIVQKKWKGKKGKLQTGYQAQVRMKGQFLSSTFDTRKKAKIRRLLLVMLLIDTSQRYQLTRRHIRMK